RARAEISRRDTVGYDLGSVFTAEVHQFLSIWVFHVQYSNSRRLCSTTRKQFLFCGKVVFKGVVIIEVVARQIGEYGDIEWNSENAVLCECMRGNFHDGFASTAFEGIHEDALKFEGFRRGVWRRKNLPSNVVFDSTDERTLAIGSLE